MLGSSFAEIVSEMPIDSSIIEGLLHGTGAYATWIPLLEAYERNNLAAIQNFCLAYHISEPKVNETYFRSSALAHAMFDGL
ncbi:MAG: hypothetical protein AAF975_06570 [Spirochaetota bacterium]